MELLHLSLLLLLLLRVLNVCGQSEVVPLRVYIDGAEGRDSLGCLNSSSTETPCQSLSLVAETLTQKHSVSIEILGHVLNLTRAVNFTDYSNITISGSGTNTTLYCNESDAGLAFIRVVNLSIYSLTIDNYGALSPSTTDQGLLSVAVYVLNCSNVLIRSVVVASSIGTGLSLYDTNGVVAITHSNFINNGITHHNKSGGSGLHIEFTICTPGFKGTNCKNHKDQNRNSRYFIQNCSFVNNVAHWPDINPGPLYPSYQVFIPRLGQGGGLYISIGSDAMNNTFIVRFCKFLNNTASYNAGGMLAEFLNSVKNNTVYVNQTTFEGNKCTATQYSSVGGLSADFMFYEESAIDGEQAEYNSFQCHLCSFKANKGDMGGGTAIFAAKATNRSSLSTIGFSNCNWTENESAMGAAVFITPAIWDYTKEGYLPVPMFSDRRFESNSAIQNLKLEGVTVKSVGYGALFVSEFQVKFDGYFHFSHNKGSAIHLSDSVIEFQERSNVTFDNNYSHNGGALGLFSSSMIKVGNGCSFSFVNNRGDSHGGAIFSDFNVATHPAYHNCFITSGDFEPINSTSTFRGNSAGDSGDSIFTSTFQSCSWLCSTGEPSSTPPEIMACIANFTFNDSDKTNSSSLSTRPAKFEMNEKSPIKLIPGLEYYIHLSASDEAQNNLSNIVYTASATNPDVAICPAFHQVSNNTVKVKGQRGAKAKLKLVTADVSLSWDITLTDCQPGYRYSNSSSKCECAASEYLGLEGCDPNVYLRQGYWMGYCLGNESELCTAFCPYGYCSYTQLHPGVQRHALPNNSSSLNSAICGPTRNNRLCGKCFPGHSVYYNSPKNECKPDKLCSLGWIFLHFI